MNLKQKNSTVKKIIIATLILIVVGAGFYLVFFKNPTQKPVENNQQTSENQPQEPPKKAEEPMVVLPRAKPIKPTTGNYSEDSHLWRLVNKSSPLSDQNYKPEIIKPNVTTRQDKSLDEQSVRKDIAPAVEQLFQAANEAGHQLQIGSGFRSADLQKMYYDNYSHVYGQEAADTFSAKPGYSEHQTGLAIDIATTDNNCYLQECFGETAAGKWLADNAHNYGFILRYPQGKEGIIDFQYEPWHFRYVGNELATALFESKLTLDEAADFINNPKAL